MAHKTPIILLVLLLLIPLVNLVPANAATRQQSGDMQGSGLTISVPEQWTFAQYQNITLRFYVHNTTNYALLTNATTDCSIYLYRPNGTYILGSPLTFDSPISNYFIWLDGSLYLTNLERQHFYVYCNNTAGASGFVESYFDVTQSGEIFGDNVTIASTFGFTALFFFLAIIMLWFSVTFVKQFDLTAESGVQRLKQYKTLMQPFFFFGAIVLIFMGINYAAIGFAPYLTTSLQTLVDSLIFIVTWAINILFYVYIYFIAYTMYNYIKEVRRRKGLKYE